MILYDVRGNPVNASFPDGVTNETVTDARVSAATLASANAEAILDLNGASTVSIDARTAAGNLTLVFEGTVDGTNYTAMAAFVTFQLLAATAAAEVYVSSVVVATTTSGIYLLDVAGFRRVRVRVSVYASGNVVVALRSTGADSLNLVRTVPSTLHVTATAAANTAATATLPAAGAGLFHYITNIHLCRNATAAVVGSATLIHTSTNLPGSPAWSVGNAMLLGGTQIDLVYTPTTPLKSLLANTATTVVMVAGGAAVLNRVNVSYYVGA